ncbi:hypothetical protein SAY87_021723 [Trapa incisa]|uniref:Agouti signaling protein n=1 Tax=Trapa incisa TaxID=236973 RepID=A0AAN7JRG0_9MYRT|nr:hypothetical protein SAY87_021723 [Trapa incisa]
MVSSSCKVAIVLFCFQVLFLESSHASGLTSIDLAPRPDLANESTLLEKQSLAPTPSVVSDPFLSSKRRV